jgi:hypothetical protein
MSSPRCPRGPEDNADRVLRRIDAFALAGFDALPNASVLVFDAALRYAVVRGGALAQHGFTASAELEDRPVAEALGAEQWAAPEELTGVAVSSFTHPDDVAVDRERLRAMLEEDVPCVTQKRYVRRDGQMVHVQVGSTAVRDGLGKPISFFTQVGDITERELALVALVERERLQQAVAELGRDVVAHPAYSVLVERAVDRVARALELECAAVLERQDDVTLVFCAAAGFEDDVIGTSIEGGPSSQAGYRLDAGKPVVVDDLATETRFRSTPLLTKLGVISSVTVPTSPGGTAYGVLSASRCSRTVA